MSIVYSLLIGLHIFVCFVLIVVVLLQAGKGGGMSGLFGGGGDNIFGGQGPAKPLTILTAVCAGLFMVTCISLSMMTKSTVGKSVLNIQTQRAPVKTNTQAPAPAAPSTPAAAQPAKK